MIIITTEILLSHVSSFIFLNFFLDDDAANYIVYMLQCGGNVCQLIEMITFVEEICIYYSQAGQHSNCI